MPGLVISCAYPRRSMMRRHALSLALAAYLALFIAAVLAVADLALTLGPSAVIASLVGGGLLGAAAICMGIDRFVPERPVPYRPFREITLRSVAPRPY